MTKHKKILGLAMGVALAMGNGTAMAESTYGYDSTGIGAAVYANARVNVKVTVPKIILLRVGASGGSPVDTLAFSAALTGGVIPGGIAPTDGSGLPSGWDATAPTFATPATQSLTAYVWTNALNGAQIQQSSVINTPLGTIAPSDISVTPTAGVGALPIHPATTANGVFPLSAARNVLHSATWAYGISGSVLGAAPAGVYEQTTTYTATTL